jgi:hypothetical protein
MEFGRKRIMSGLEEMLNTRGAYSTE